MATEVKVPALGESITEATLGQWLKQPGDAVAQDEPIASLETDKVAIEVPSPMAGTMGEQRVKVGDTVAVGAVIATVEAGDPGDRDQALTAGRAAARGERDHRGLAAERPLGGGGELVEGPRGTRG